MIAASTVSVFTFFIKFILLLAGVYVIAALTPKLAAYIDKRRASEKSPYESAPLPERVDTEDNNSSKDH